MTELSALAGSEGYAACDDEGQKRYTFHKKLANIRVLVYNHRAHNCQEKFPAIETAHSRKILPGVFS